MLVASSNRRDAAAQAGDVDRDWRTFQLPLALGRPLAELAVDGGAPTLGRTDARQRAGVPAAGANRRDAGAQAADFDRHGAANRDTRAAGFGAGRRPVTKLAIYVVTPALDPTRARERACVIVARADRRHAAGQAADFDGLIAARDAAGVLAAEAFMIVHHPQWQRARQLLAEGAIGRLRRIDGAFSYNNRDTANIRNQAAMGGGGLRDIGVYVLGGARFATNLDPTEVQARFEWENGVDVYAAISARFGDADYVNFTSIRMHPRQEITFHGEAGVLRLPVPYNARVFGEARLELHRGIETITERWPAVNHYELQAAAFNRAVREGVSYPCPLEFSRGTQVAIDAAFASAA